MILNLLWHILPATAHNSIRALFSKVIIQHSCKTCSHKWYSLGNVDRVFETRVLKLDNADAESVLVFKEAWRDRQQELRKLWDERFKHQ